MIELIRFNLDRMELNPKEEFDFSNIRVLIADNSKEESTEIKSMLKQFGIKSDMVFNSDKAVKQVKIRKATDYGYKLCIIDYDIQEGGGIDTFEKIRSRADENIQAILITANDTQGIREEAAKAGIAKVISKPLFQSTLFNIMIELFGKIIMDKQEKMPKRDFKGLRILLAEDNEMNMEIALEVLRRSGMTVDSAINGQDALDKFIASKENQYQAILMDIQMPVMDGYEATRQIRASKHPQAKSIPIIATTANAFSEDVSTALACGMNGHISKPIDFNKLYDALEKYLK